MADKRRPRLTEPGLRVLRTMLAEPATPMYGLDLIDRTGVKSGTLYPLLARLAESGWLEAEPERVDASAAGRPRRTYYRLSAEGQAGALEVLAALSTDDSAPGGLRWMPT